MREKLRNLLAAVLSALMLVSGMLPSAMMAKEAKAEIVNEFNKNDIDNWMKALSHNGSKLVNESNYANMFTAHKIYVTEGDTITWGYFGKDEYCMELYDANDQFIKKVYTENLKTKEKGTTVTGVANKQYQEVIAEYTVDESSAAYARILGNISTIDNFMIIKNLEGGVDAWPSEYIPFDDPAQADNPLYGKKVLFAGDSICNAVKDPDHPYYGWAGRVGTTNSMKWTNAGISGATISTALSGYDPSVRILTQIEENKNNQYDYVILQGGMNDAYCNQKMGEIAPGFNPETFDAKTFSGAVEELIYTAATNYPGARLGFIITYQTPNSNWGGATADSKDYFRRLKEICAKWNVSYFDMFDGTVMVDGKEKSISFDILDVRTGSHMYNGDPYEIHIGSKGYDAISGYVGEWMKTLPVYTLEEYTPVLKVNFDDESANDVSGHGNNGTINGAIEFVEGTKGKAAHIQNPNTANSANTAEQYIDFGKAADLQFGTDDFTILFDYMNNNTKTADAGIIGNKSWASGGNPGWVIYGYGNVEGINVTATGGTRTDAKSAKALEKEVWHKMAAVFDRDGMITLYADGEKLSEKDFSKDADKSVDALDFVIGADGSKKLGSENICIDEVEVYRHAFTKEELDNKEVIIPEEPEEPVDPSDRKGTDFTGKKRSVQLSKALDEIPMTFEAWVNVPTSMKGKRSCIIGNFADYYLRFPIVNMEITAAGEPRLYWYVGSDICDYKATGVNVCTGQWTHIAITTEPDPANAGKTLLTTYINGEKANSKSQACRMDKLDQRLYIGRDWRDSLCMNGQIGEIRLWSDTRTAEEIKATYDSEIAADEQGLLANIDLSEEVDGIFVDKSANNNFASEAWYQDDSLFRKAADGYQTIAVIPDTQTISYFKPASFDPIGKWIADNKDELGIQFAVHVGDIVNERDLDREWTTAAAAMKHLEDVNLPYVFSPGNHDTVIQKVDGVWHGVRSTPLMNKYFPYSKFSQLDTFGGAWKEGEMDNTYSFFTVSGVDFLVISMEENPRDEVLEWADGVIAANPDKKVIITTHEYMFWDGELYTDQTEDHLPFVGGQNYANQVYDKLVSKYENIVSVICGHCPYTDVVERHDTGVNGNDITSFMADVQSVEKYDIQTNGGPGYGMVMLLSFKENSNEVSVRWYSTVRNAFFGHASQYETTMALHDEKEEVAPGKLLLDFITRSVENTNLDEYLPEKQDEFKAALAEAKDVLANSEDQSVINASVVRLHKAWMDLRFEPTKEKLQEIREKYGV